MKHVITFVEGMDKDTSFNKYPNTRYLHSENFRFIYDEENSRGILTNDVGDQGVLTFSGTLLGHTIIRNTLVLFILRYEPQQDLNIFELYQIPNDVVLNSEQTNIETYLKISSIDFGYTVDTKIKAIGRYESENIEKLYWTDGISFKYCNLKDPNLLEQDISKFEAYPVNNASTVTITGLTTGSLLSGKVQYGYQLYNVNGAATGVNGLSRLINITSSTGGHTRDFKGDLPGVNTNKGCVLRIDNIDRNFERIRVYRIFYTDFVQVPEVYIIEDVVVTGDSMTFTDLTTIGIRQIAYEELVAMSADLLFNTLETKNNLLFVADVTEKVFDLGIDISVSPEDTTAFEETSVFVTVKGLSGEMPIDGSSGEILPGATVSISSTIGSYTRQTNSSGVASFIDIPKITYNINITYPGYISYTSIINTRTTTSLTITLIANNIPVPI